MPRAMLSMWPCSCAAAHHVDVHFVVHFQQRQLGLFKVADHVERVAVDQRQLGGADGGKSPACTFRLVT
jgi:hypothetical protein